MILRAAYGMHLHACDCMHALVVCAANKVAFLKLKHEEFMLACIQLHDTVIHFGHENAGVS